MTKAERPALHRISFPEGIRTPRSIRSFESSPCPTFKAFLDVLASDYGGQAQQLYPGTHRLGPNTTERELEVIASNLATYRHIVASGEVGSSIVEVEAEEPVGIPDDAEGLVLVSDTAKGMRVFDMILPKTCEAPEAPPVPQDVAVVV